MMGICIAASVISCEKQVVNKIPVADAGISSSIRLPADSVFLSGSGTDEDGEIVAYLWSQVSGNSNVVIRNPGSPESVVKGFKAGSYVFQLMVVDNDGATAVDTVSVDVIPAMSVSLTIQPTQNPTEVHIWGNATNKEGSHNGAAELGAISWTHDGVTVGERGLFRFDLSSIPQAATIISAKLSLYSNPTPMNGDLVHANSGSNNAMLIQRVTSPWMATSVRWNNQPATTTTDQIVIPHTAQASLDLVDVNVTHLVQPMVNANYGFMIKLQTEAIYNSRIFASSFHPLASKHPKLIVVYSGN